jgi:hypothetical protein
MKYTDEEKLEFREFWESLSQFGKENALRCGQGGTLDFTKKKIRSWTISKELIDAVYQ